MSITKEKISKERFFELFRFFIYIFCSVGIFMHLLEYDNSIYQTSKDTQNMYAMLFFLILALAAQRAVILNWQTLLVTVLYIPIAFYQARSFIAFAPDLSEYVILETIVIWLAIVLVTDMVVTKRARSLKETNVPIVAILALQTILIVLLFGKNAVAINYTLILLFFLIPLSGTEWSRIVRGVLTGSGFTFLAVVILSAILNPLQIGERWYGYFLNIGAFGEFLGLMTAFCVIALFLAKEKFGRKSIPYVLAWVCLALVIVAESFNGTTTYLAGLILLIAVLFVFGSKKIGFKTLYVRISSMALVIMIGAILFLFITQFFGSSIGLKERLDSSSGGIALKAAMSGVYKIVEKMAHFRDIVNGARADYIQSSAGTFLLTMSSARIGIFEKYLEHTSFGPNSGAVWHRGYLALGAHSQFIQTLFENGFLVGGLNILVFVGAWCSAIAGYVRQKSKTYFVPMVALTMMLGIWIGEVASINYPITFFSLLLAYPIFAEPLPKREKVSIKAIMGNKKDRAVVLGFAAAMLFGICLFSCKLLMLNKSDRSGVEEYVILSKNETSKDESEAYIVFNQGYVLDNAQCASWGDRGYVAVTYDSMGENHLMVLEFTAETANDTPVMLKICNNAQTEYVEVTSTTESYYALFRGVPDESCILFIIEGQNGLTKPVELSDIKLVDYGPDASENSVYSNVVLAQTN